ncbi:MAG: hypothetical protein H8E38_12910 [SAR324 cluster bacterium]|nr:hypothetical protein [SAR324 cluster bacterium]
MKKFAYLLPLLGIISFSFLGCSKSDDSSTSSASSTSTSTYTRSNTPAKSSVAVPASLSASGSASSRTAYATDYSSSAIFYAMLKSVVSVMKGTVSSADLNLMLVDTRIASGYAADNSTCYEQGAYTITFSQEMYNALVAQEKEFGGTEGESGSMSSSFKAYIGKTISPPVAYKFEDISAGGYNHQISTGDSCSSLTETFRWNSAKTKLSSQFKDTSGSDTFKGTFTFDETNKNSTFQMEMSGSMSVNMYISMKTCSDNSSTGMTGDCVIYEFKESFSDSTYGTSLMSAVGKADDSGGYAKAIMSYTQSSDNSSMELQYKEYWQGDGTVTAVSTCISSCSSSSSWTTQGTENTTYAEDSYDSGTTTVSVSSVTADGSYLLIESGKTPSGNPEAVLGYGEIRSGKTEWEFWGPDTSITLDVYIINSNGTFTIQSGASVTLS